MKYTHKQIKKVLSKIRGQELRSNLTDVVKDFEEEVRDLRETINDLGRDCSALIDEVSRLENELDIYGT